MADASLALQSGVIAQLTGGSPPAVSCEVYPGRAPQNPTFPYAVLEDLSTLDWGTKTEQGQETTINIHVWSRKSGTQGNAGSPTECKQIMAAIYAALHEVEFSISGQDNVSCRFDFSQVIADADGKTWHGVGRYRLLLSAA